jgi:hypothetical protein
MIKLYINYFTPKTEDRYKEINHCIIMNATNPIIDSVVILNETDKVFEYEKVVNIKIDKRPTYNDFFRLSKPSSYEDIHVVTNSDCFLDHETTHRINNIKSNEAWCLSRWDVIYDGVPAKLSPYNRPDSQDAWIFRGEIKDIEYGDFYMGVPGCDNRISHELHTAGYSLRNPMWDVKLIHYHMTASRNYNGIVPPPYKYVNPSHM